MKTGIQNRLRSLRKEKGMTLEHLAKKTFSTKGYIWELENKAMVRPSARKIIDIAAALDTTVDYLMDGTVGPYDGEAALLRVYRELPAASRTIAIDILRCLV